MRADLNIVDRLSRLCAWIAAWLFCAAGGMLTYEVVARYFFVRPTVWAAELSQLCLIWGSLLAMAWAMGARRHISVVALTSHLPAGLRRWFELFSLAVVVAFSVPVIWKGGEIAMDSYLRGRSTGTMLNIPKWWAEISVPVGFGLLAVQALVDAIRQLPSDERSTDRNPVR